MMMGKHAIVPAPTNVAERVKRTMLQVGIPAYVLLVAVLPPVLDLVLAQFGEQMPAQVTLLLAGAATALTGLAGLVTKIMALPVVNDWLSRYTTFGTHPRATAKDIHERGA